MCQYFFASYNLRGTWLPPDSGSCRRRQQDCSQHTIRPLRVHSDTINGLKNAAQAFQRLMDTVCNGLDFVFLYIDDILVSSTSTEQHMLHLREVFHRLSTHALVINVSKCQFRATTIDYIGHHITRQGAIPLPAKVEAIRTFARPTTIKGLQQFVGMLNFYHRFVPNAAHIMRPI